MPVSPSPSSSLSSSPSPSSSSSSLPSPSPVPVKQPKKEGTAKPAVASVPAFKAQNGGRGEEEGIREEKKSVQDQRKEQAAKIFLGFGYVATALSIITWIPVTAEVLLNPAATCALNIWQYLLALLANILWIVYSAGIQAWPLLGSSAAVVVMLIIIISQKYIYAGHCDEVQDTEEPAFQQGETA